MCNAYQVLFVTTPTTPETPTTTPHHTTPPSKKQLHVRQQPFDIPTHYGGRRGGGASEVKLTPGKKVQFHFDFVSQDSHFNSLPNRTQKRRFHFLL
jgi:hypothetical protein